MSIFDLHTDESTPDYHLWWWSSILVKGERLYLLSATSIRIFDDDHWLANISVWESLGYLMRFIASPGHLAIMRRRAEWFEKPDKAYTVMWWVLQGHRPVTIRYTA